jgi:hypothetical protein
MKLTRMRLAGVAAALTTIAVAAPLSSTATAAPVPIAADAWDGFPAVTLTVTAPVVGQVATVIGPAIITIAPASFINTNNQVTADGAWSGGQAAP